MAVTFGNAEEVDNAYSPNAAAGLNISYDSVEKKHVISAKNPSGNKTVIYGIDYGDFTTNLTADNFIGFADSAYSNGNTGTVNVVGNTSTKSGLTAGKKYYTQINGGLSTTADSPSVEAGTALSSTKLLIKG